MAEERAAPGGNRARREAMVIKQRAGTKSLTPASGTDSRRVRGTEVGRAGTALPWAPARGGAEGVSTGVTKERGAAARVAAGVASGGGAPPSAGSL